MAVVAEPWMFGHSADVVPGTREVTDGREAAAEDGIDPVPIWVVGVLGGRVPVGSLRQYAPSCSPDSIPGSHCSRWASVPIWATG